MSKILFIWCSQGVENGDFSKNISVSPTFLEMLKYFKDKNYSINALDTSFSFSYKSLTSAKELYKTFETIFKEIKIQNPDIIIVDGPPYEILIQLEFITSLKKNILNKNIIFMGYYCSVYSKNIARILPDNIIILKLYNKGALLNVIKSIQNKLDFLKIPNISIKISENIYSTDMETSVMDISPNVFDFEDFLQYDLKKYPSISLFSSIGCKYNCSYCADKSVFPLFYGYGIDYIVSQVDHLHNLYNIKKFDFRDFSFFNNLKSEIIMEQVSKINQNITFSFNSRIDQINERRILLMEKCNFNEILLGIENANKSVLKFYNKNNPITNTQIYDIIHKMSSKGILSTVSIIFGSPIETKKDMVENLRFINQLSKIKNIRFDHYNLEPRPGTKLFNLLVKNNLKCFNILSIKKEGFLSSKFKHLESYSKNFLTQKYITDVGFTFSIYLYENNSVNKNKFIELLDKIHYVIEKINEKKDLSKSELMPIEEKLQIVKTGNRFDPIDIKNKGRFQFINSYHDSKYGIFSSSLPDIIAVKYNIKPLARLSCNSIEDFRILKGILAKEGIYCGCSDKKILSGRNPYIGFNDPRNGLVDSDSDEFGTLYIYISKSQELINKVKDNDPEMSYKPSNKTIKEFSEALGYPKCCILNCIKNLNSNKKDFFIDLIFQENKSFYLNNLYNSFSNYYLSFHTPCSYTCNKSLEYNKSIFAAIKKEYPHFAEKLRDILKMPSLIWFDTEGKLIDGIDNRFGVVFDGSLMGNEIVYSRIHIFNMRPPTDPRIHAERRMLIKFIRGNSVKIFRDRLEIYLDGSFTDVIHKENHLQGVPMVFGNL